MRADPEEQSFSEWLMNVGSGLNNENVDDIKIPDECIINGSIIDQIFPPHEPLEDVEVVKLKCILCPTNDETFELNDQVLDRLKGISSVYYSSDSIECDNDQEKANFQTEFLR